jgi:cyclopropane fatty-acyl-phospholipid synthase-like methyltransferase
LARSKEFLELFKNFPLGDGERVLDVPSGGKYLKNFIQGDVDITSLEFTSGFSKNVRVVSPYEDWGLSHGDRAISLASLHHISNLDTFLLNITNSIRPGGLIHLADVEADSQISRFLDEFVGHWTPGGHQGLYRDWGEIAWPKDLEVISIEVRKCPWEFESIEDLINFCKNLFYLKDCPDTALRSYLESDIGIYSENERVYLDWELVYIDLKVCNLY